jgi:diguanylate cyclase (GGDEF)-like protein
MDQVISVDPLTKLSNRKNMIFRYEEWASDPNNSTLYLMIIDANKFKSINDTYGHIEGDAALVRIADAMRMACANSKKKSNCVRYGGDEFVILIWTSKVEEVNAIKDGVRSHLKDLNDEANVPYDLTVSVGIAKAEKNQDIKDVLEIADKELYEEKAKVK